MNNMKSAWFIIIVPALFSFKSFNLFYTNEFTIEFCVLQKTKPIIILERLIEFHSESFFQNQ